MHRKVMFVLQQVLLSKKGYMECVCLIRFRPFFLSLSCARALHLMISKHFINTFFCMFSNFIIFFSLSILFYKLYKHFELYSVLWPAALKLQNWRFVGDMKVKTSSMTGHTFAAETCLSLTLTLSIVDSGVQL